MHHKEIHIYTDSQYAHDAASWIDAGLYEDAPHQVANYDLFAPPYLQTAWKRNVLYIHKVKPSPTGLSTKQILQLTFAASLVITLLMKQH